MTHTTSQEQQKSVGFEGGLNRCHVVRGTQPEALQGRGARQTMATRGSLIIFILLAELFSQQGAAAVNRRPSAPPIVNDALVITIESVEGGGDSELMDLGVASAGQALDGKPSRAAKVNRVIVIRVNHPLANQGETAILRAWVREIDPNVSVRVNGIVLGPAPSIIVARMRVGVNVAVRLDVEIPTSAPPGNHFSAIEWDATTN
jgi:hypothetical protein